MKSWGESVPRFFDKSKKQEFLGWKDGEMAGEGGSIEERNSSTRATRRRSFSTKVSTKSFPIKNKAKSWRSQRKDKGKQIKKKKKEFEEKKKTPGLKVEREGKESEGNKNLMASQNSTRS